MESLLENKRKLALLEDHKIRSNIIYAKETMPEDECLYSSCNIRSSLMNRYPYSQLRTWRLFNGPSWLD